MIVIDDITYEVSVKRVKRKARFLDKFAERTEDGVLHRELIGVYFNYEIEFSRSTDVDEYAALWDKLTEVEEFHTVTVPSESGPYTFTAYFSDVGDELIKTDDDMVLSFWKNLTVNFIAKEPA